MTARFHVDDQLVIEIGEHESAADLVRRRPDLFRATESGVLFLGSGGRGLAIHRCANPEPYQLPLHVPAHPDVTALLGRCLARTLRRTEPASCQILPIVTHELAGID